MSNTASGVPKLGITHHLQNGRTYSLVTIPLPLMQSVTNDLSRAHLSLQALSELFKNGSLGNEEACLPHLLSYMVQDLEHCNDTLLSHTKESLDGGNHG